MKYPTIIKILDIVQIICSVLLFLVTAFFVVDLLSKESVFYRIIALIVAIPITTIVVICFHDAINDLRDEDNY